MCGIAGFWDSYGRAAKVELQQTALCMASALQHRGPDDQGIWADETASLGLGHRRLAILDLSREGHQPMLSADKRYVLIFNGEIYNFEALRKELAQRGHVFRGRSDTEVMLAAFDEWGLRPALERLVGMFAFALWDRRTRRLHLARDRAGEKPLYYGWSGGVFVFGSELKALRAHPSWRGQINRGALALLVRLGYIPAPHCIYDNIYKLPPGCVLTLNESDVRARSISGLEAYWSAQSVGEHAAARPFRGGEKEAGEQLREMLLESVGQQMVADVPLGAFLSGGIDSSLVVALMQTQSRRAIKTFSIGFPQKSFNEAPFAKAIAAHLGTDHTELYVEDKDLLGVIARLPGIYDEPLADPSQIPTVLLCQLARANVKVSLSGDAGDELFGGYSHYRKAQRIWGTIGRIPGRFRLNMARCLKSFSNAGLDSGTSFAQARRVFDRLSNLADVLPAPSERLLYHILMSPNRDSQVWLRDVDEPRTQFDEASIWENLPESLERMTHLDFVTYLPDDVLVKVDRAAMSVGLETRVPLLDHRIVEFTRRLPTSLKQKRGEGKWMLRQILHQYVPPALVDRPKRGFAAPIGEWLRGPTREWAEHLLDETRLRQEGFFESRQIRKRWLEHLAQKRDWSPGLWHVLMFQSWLDEQGPMQVESERGTALVSEAGTIVERCERAAVQTTGQQREQCEQSGRFPEPNPPRQISGSRSRPSIGPELRNGPPRATAQAFVLKRAQAAAKVTFGVGLALLTMNLASLWIYDLPSAPNPMFGDVHQPGRRFRQRIEGNGSGVFTSNCVRRASLPATDRTPVLMVLGNSYTEATQVEDKDHFAYLLEQELRGTPVLAIGISGFSVADYIAGAATFKKLFRPDWVVIPVRAGDFAANAWNKNKGGGYAYFEMEKASSQPRDLETPLVSEIVSEPAGLLRVVTTPISQPGWLSTETRERFPFWDPLVNFAYLRKSDLKAWMQGHDRPWFHAEAEVSGVERRPEEAMGQYPLRDEMKLLAKAYEGRLTLLYLPNFDPKFPAKESEAEKTLEKLAKRQGVRFVSLREEFPALAEAGHAPYGFSNTRFNWGHWNRDGHKAAAEVLFEELQQLQAIGKIHTLMAYSGKPTDI